MNVECNSRSQSSEYHWVEEEQNNDGEWVRYSEVRDEIEKLEAEIQRLKVKSGETVKEVKTKKRVNEWSNWRETGR